LDTGLTGGRDKMPGGNDVGAEAAMLNYLARRLVLALIPRAAISVLTFVIIRAGTKMREVLAITIGIPCWRLDRLG
jgi:hypothetical protein